MDDINEQLRRAVSETNVNAVKSLLSAGASPNQILGCRTDKNTLLHLTSNVDIVRELLLYNANVNVKNHRGDTPILTAITNRSNIETIRELLENGAEINRVNIGAQFVLHHALSCSAEFEVIKELLENGADVSVINNNIKTVLHLALSQRYEVKVIKELIKYGADVNAKDCSQQTGLHLAFIQRYGVEVIKEILKYGADVNAKDCNQQVALHLALTYSYGVEVIKELLKYGADVNALNNKDRTPLHKALGTNIPKNEIIKELLRYGAEVHQGSHKRFHAAFFLAIKINARLAKLIIKIILIKNFDYHEQIIQLDKYNGLTVYNRLTTFRNECILEIVKMKSVILDENDNLSLYEFVRSNFIECNPDVSPNNKLCMKLSKINYSIEYPIYNDFILDELKYFLQRAVLLRKLNELRIYTEINDSNVNNENNNQVVLDLLSKLKITEYLSNNDLLNFIEAFDESNED